ncbi:MAG: DUF4912 domain-containing protein [Aulosira sp. DedVER01a]
MTTNLLVPTHILAQSATDAPSFPLPTTLENGTTVRIDGSSSLSAINQNLKQSFEQQFSGTKVEVAANGTDAALKAVLDGKIDIAALGRGLTPKEQAQGLEQVRLHREKIAIIVGADNPFKASLTARQFARIFRGQITDWSQLGRAKGKIRVIDRPTSSETRNTFRSYPAFKSANFATGSTATQVADDNTAEIVKQLGKDGISYALANQVSQLPGVRVLQVHQTSPTDAKYPFSQPLVYVYKKSPSPGIAGFLGFAIAPPGQQAIEAARTAEAAAIAQGGLTALATTPTTAPTPEATTAATTSPTPEATTAVTTSPTAEAITTTTDSNVTTAPNDSSANPAANDNATMQKEAPFWLLLPLLVIAVLGGLSYWWFLKRRPRAVEEADKDSTISPATPAIASGAGAAISSGFSDTGLTDETRNNADTAWDTEAPAAVVNTSYPQMAEVPTAAATSELPKAEVPPATLDNSEVPIVASDVQNWGEAQPQGESNIAEDNNSIGSAALAAGAGLAAGAATWSTISGTESNAEDSSNPVGNSNYSIWDTPESELPIIETAATIPDLPDVPEQTGDVELPIIETAATLPDLPDVQDVALDAVADEAESTTDGTEEDIIEIVSNLPEQTSEEASTNLGVLAGGAAVAGAGIGAWANIYGSQEDNHAPVVEAAPNASGEDSVNLRPHTPKWAYVSWQISDTQKQTLENSGSQLTLRLYDVTDLDLSYQSPQFVQQYECDETAHDRFLAIPTSDRNYMAELGYITDGDRWVKIARSAIVRVFSNPYIPGEETAESAAYVEDSISLTLRDSESAYVSWQISDNQKQALQDSGSQLTLRLYDVTDLDLSYQNPHLVEQYECDATARDRFLAIPTSDHNYMAEIGYITDGARWVKIARSAIVRVFSNPYIPGEETANLSETNLKDSIIFTPKTSTSADVSWQISDVNKQALQSTGCQLALRLYDVTGIDLSYQTPQFIQQYEFDTTTENSVVEIPASDRDYIAEIGYATDSENWISIARSEIVRVFSHPYREDKNHADLLDTDRAQIESSITLTPRTPKWAYICWYISDTEKQVLQNSGISQLSIRLYDVTDIDLSYQNPQFVQQYECEELSNDRFVAIPTSDRDYIVEIGYVTDSDRWMPIARSSTVRIFSRLYPDFWFVADAELIIHGATEPNANVNIAGHPIKLKPDGTFHVRIPFSDGLIDYLMTATSADGQQASTIHKKFSQDTPEA